MSVEEEFIEGGGEVDSACWSTRCFLLSAIMQCLTDNDDDNVIGENNIGSGGLGFCGNENCFVNVVAESAKVIDREKNTRDPKNKCKYTIYRLKGLVTFELTSKFCGHEACKCDELEGYLVKELTNCFGSCFEVLDISWDVIGGSHDNTSISRTTIKTSFGFTNKIND